MSCVKILILSMLSEQEMMIIKKQVDFQNAISSISSV
jgi:hypothetical protein